MVSPRKLRSKATDQGSNNKLLYDFDNINSYLYSDKPIGITKKSSNDYYSWFGVLNNLPKNQVHEVTEIDQILPRRVNVDPLPSTEYEIFHRKMKKDEKQMINEEKGKNLYELDILTNELDQLNQYNWERSLSQLTKINDPKDTNELELKKELTINEIEKVLRKHENWKKRSEIFNNEVKSFVPRKDDTDDDYKLSLEEVKLKRNRERRSKYGPKVKLNLDNNFCLVIDPFGSPKIVKNGKVAKPVQAVSSKEVVKKENPIATERIREDSYKQKKVKLESLTKNTKIDFKNDENVLFGTLFKDLPTFANGYQLPLGLRRQKK